MDDLGADRRTWNTKIQYLKNQPAPPQLAQNDEELMSSKLLAPKLLDSIKQQNDASLFVSALESTTGDRGLHVSKVARQVTRAGNTMLHVAAACGRVEVAKLVANHFPRLITKGNVNGDTPLHVAARSLFNNNNNVDVIKVLMESYGRHFANEQEEEEEDGGDVASSILLRIKNKCGNTAMHEAVMAANVGGVEELLKADGSVAHYLNKEGKSPLYLAVEKRNRHIIRMLMDTPFVNRQKHQGTSPLHALIMVTSSGKTKYSDSQPLIKSWFTYQRTLPREDSAAEIINTNELLIKSWLTEQRTLPREDSAAEIINTNGTTDKPITNREISEAPETPVKSTYGLLIDLVNRRPDLIHLKDQKGNTPLHYCASATGDIEAVRTIMRASSSSALEWNDKGYLPIHVACRKGHVHIVNEFVGRSDFDPMEFLNDKGQNILHIAAKRGKDRVVKYILREKKLQNYDLLNQKDKNGNTPLHLASKYLFPKVLLLLAREIKLNINLLNNKGMTARDIVMLIRKTPPTIRELLSYSILNSMGAPLSKHGRRLRRFQSKTPQIEWIKDRVSTILVVAILVATVTFAAGFTVPGGFYDSDEKDRKKLGTATLLHRRTFQIFTICDVIAMYSSTMGSFILLWAQLGDFHLAFNATYLALHMVAAALLTMSIAFMAAIHLIVGNLPWLAHTVIIMGIFFILMFLALYIILTFPLGTRWFLLRHISNLIFQIIIPFSGSYSKFKKEKAKKGGELEDQKDED